MTLSIFIKTLSFFLIISTIICIALIILLCTWIYRNTGERGAAKRAEREYRYWKYYEIRDEIDEIEKELAAINEENERIFTEKKDE